MTRSNSIKKIKSSLSKEADSAKAKVLQSFFKTGPGEYAEGDIFLGVTVPKIRKLVGKFQNLKLSLFLKLVRSRIHEERLLGLLLLVHRYEQGTRDERRDVFNAYLRNKKFVNNWDLVDLTAHKIVGHYLDGRNIGLLRTLANSKNLWDRRIAIISTFHFIRQGRDRETLEISKKLLNDDHDLIHKAVGWMLRELGKRDLASEKLFLSKYYRKMPRTMLRYAIEQFPETERRRYLKNQV